MAVDTSSAAALATFVVVAAAAAFPLASDAPILCTSAATEAMISGETRTYVIGHLAVLTKTIARQSRSDGLPDAIAANPGCGSNGGGYPQTAPPAAEPTSLTYLARTPVL
ncbi:hypothetical protein LAUMK4_00135 [Mycobacterium persicum]|uniref:Uncharacterized protein n=1 Tax=Mycobacterium persicum TaxID=1487726 RepID=A0ABY6RBH5_9MYCO|nr:hypothetical protein LAUMK15_00485 [Mycobacterium persicum]VAZ86914.1 hypothetical protein LAUMK4_00135 [Mycobacterium persicum]